MFKLASVNSKEIPEEFNMFGELFTLYKKYYYPEDKEGWWEEVIGAFRGMSNKYNTTLCNELCIVCINAIESRKK